MRTRSVMALAYPKPQFPHVGKRDGNTQLTEGWVQMQQFMQVPASSMHSMWHIWEMCPPGSNSNWWVTGTFLFQCVCERERKRQGESKIFMNFKDRIRDIKDISCLWETASNSTCSTAVFWWLSSFIPPCTGHTHILPSLQDKGAQKALGLPWGEGTKAGKPALKVEGRPPFCVLPAPPNSCSFRGISLWKKVTLPTRLLGEMSDPRSGAGNVQKKPALSSTRKQKSTQRQLRSCQQNSGANMNRFTLAKKGHLSIVGMIPAAWKPQHPVGLFVCYDTQVTWEPIHYF